MQPGFIRVTQKSDDSNFELINIHPSTLFVHDLFIYHDFSKAE